MPIKFTKMQGLGNDFMVIDGMTQDTQAITSKHYQQWANRHTGIGFDQCIMIKKATSAGVDFNYHIFNADGGEVEQCGNGARCVAEYLALKDISAKKQLILATPFDRIQSTRLQSGKIAIDFAVPRSIQLEQSLKINQQIVTFDQVQLSNPHAIIWQEDIASAPVLTLGDSLSQHAHFPAGTNVEFVQIISPTHLAVRVRERGVGETLACGTGAIASMVAARVQRRCEAIVTVSLPGGDLLIAWPDEKASITMTGPAVMVYDGVIEL